MPKNQPTPQESPLLYFGMNTEHSESVMDQQPPKCLLIQRCKNLSLNKFLDAYCNNDLSVLIISGEPTADELKDAWDGILFEYSSLIKNGDADYLLKLSKNISVLGFEIFYTEAAADLLKVHYDKDVVDYLITELGYFGDFNPEQTESYQKDINVMLSLVKGKKQDLEELKAEYERLNNVAEGKKQSEEEFELVIASLGKYAGYRLDKDAVMVSEFASVFTLYLKEQDYLNNQKNGSGQD
jgi:hypothetical protein